MGLETVAAIGLAAMAANAISSKISEGSAEDKQSAAMKDAQGKIAAYRPEMAKAMQQGIMNRSGAYQGAENVLSSLYGPGAAPVPAGLTNNPMAQVFGPGVNPGGAPPPTPMATAMSQPNRLMPQGSPGVPAFQPNRPVVPPADPLAGRR